MAHINRQPLWLNSASSFNISMKYGRSRTCFTWYRWCACRSRSCRRRRTAGQWCLRRWECSGQHSGSGSSRWGRPGRRSARSLLSAYENSLPAARWREERDGRQGIWERLNITQQRRGSFQQTGAIKSEPHQLLSFPVCSLHVDLQTTITDYFDSEEKLKSQIFSAKFGSYVIYVWLLNRFRDSMDSQDK